MSVVKEIIKTFFVPYFREFMVAANPNQNGNPNQDTGVKPHPERIARKLKKNFTLHVLASGYSGQNSRGKLYWKCVFLWIISKAKINIFGNLFFQKC